MMTGRANVGRQGANYRSAFAALAILAAALGSASAFAQAPAADSPAGGADPAAPTIALPPPARGVDVEEHIGQQIPLDTAFTDAEGKIVHLADYFKDGKPAIIAMVYYHCPIVCDVVMKRLAETIGQLDYTVGTDYRALLFSVDPTETVRDAAAAKMAFISGYNREATPEVQAGWQFHVTDESAARRLSEALGFKFRKIKEGTYSHPVALFILTPDGRISRYLYGFTYPVRDMKLALMEASQGKLVKTIGDRVLQRCYAWDPNSASYTLAATRVMQAGGLVTIGGLGLLIGGLFVGERLRRRRVGLTAAKPPIAKTIVMGGAVP